MNVLGRIFLKFSELRNDGVFFVRCIELTLLINRGNRERQRVCAEENDWNIRGREMRKLFQRFIYKQRKEGIA